jgi:hypothetical protein
LEGDRVTRPPPALWSHPIAGQALRAFVARFNRIGFPAGSRISSWWRTPEANDGANGGEFSQHLLGLSIDVVSPRPRELVAAAQRAGLQAIYHNAGSGWHVHIQAAPRGYVQRLIALAPDLAPWVGRRTPQAAPRPPASGPVVWT